VGGKAVVGGALAPGELDNIGQNRGSLAGETEGGVGDFNQGLLRAVVIETLAVMPGLSFRSSLRDLNDGGVGDDVLVGGGLVAHLRTTPRKVPAGERFEPGGRDLVGSTPPMSASRNHGGDFHLGEVVGDQEESGSGKLAWTVLTTSTARLMTVPRWGINAGAGKIDFGAGDAGGAHFDGGLALIEVRHGES